MRTSRTELVACPEEKAGLPTCVRQVRSRKSRALYRGTNRGSGSWCGDHPQPDEDRGCSTTMLVRFSTSKRSAATLTPTAGDSLADTPNLTAGNPSVRFRRFRPNPNRSARISSRGDSALSGRQSHMPICKRTGLVNDHLVDCLRYRVIQREIADAI
jgi:hypothetical protein